MHSPRLPSCPPSHSPFPLASSRPGPAPIPLGWCWLPERLPLSRTWPLLHPEPPAVTVRAACHSLKGNHPPQSVQSVSRPVTGRAWSPRASRMCPGPSPASSCGPLTNSDRRNTAGPLGLATEGTRKGVGCTIWNVSLELWVTEPPTPAESSSKSHRHCLGCHESIQAADGPSDP